MWRSALTKFVQKSSPTKKEESRIAALKRIGVMDTLPEKIFDNITALASQICATPIALVSLVDENRQWFKSHHGVDITETPRDVSFCSRAIERDEAVFEVQNSFEDARFAKNPLVTAQPGAVFYAGAVLRMASGERVGTLCVIDHKPRKLTAQQSNALKFLADQVVALFELRSATERLVTQDQAFADERVKLTNLLGHMPVGVCLLEDPSHRYTYFNSEFEKLMGANREILGKSVKEALPSLQSEALLKILNNIYQTGQSYTAKEVHMPSTEADGTVIERYLNFNYEASRRSDGAIYGIAVTCTDVTEIVLSRKVAEDRGVHLELALHAAQIGTWTLDLQTHLVTWSDRGAEIFGYAHAGDKDIKDAFNRVHPEDRQRVQDKIASAIHSSTGHYEDVHRIQIPHGNERWVSASGQVIYEIKNGQKTPVRYAGTLIDVTESTNVKAEILKSRDEAANANAAKSAFLANMSHEIRTPLGAIIGFTDLLSERDLPLEERTQYLQTISRNGKSLTRIIDDILDLAKVESGKLAIEQLEFSLHDLVDEVLDLFRERAKSKSLFLRVIAGPEAPERIISDPTRLRQILINLIGNAIKFTEVGGISLSIDTQEKEDRHLQISFRIKDSGIGLTEEEQSRLFVPFMQADNSTTRKFGGTGLGLALSKRLAKALGGDLLIEESAPMIGCTFNFSISARLPVKGARSLKPLSGAGSKLTSVDVLKGLRVLVADDSQDNQQLLRLILAKYGVSVEFADNGADAYQKAISNPYDLILMDIQMPVMDGYEATRKLRESGFQKPIIALTAHAMAEERARTKAVGCTTHLTKPIDQAELIWTLEEFTLGQNEPARSPH